MLKTVKDRILVQKLSEEKGTGLIITEAVSSNKATVIAVGPEVNTVKINDIVLLSDRGEVSFDHKDQEYFVLPEENILAIL